MQPNNRSILTYDVAERGFTATLSVDLETNPLKNGVIKFYYYICKTWQNNHVVHPAGPSYSSAN